MDSILACLASWMPRQRWYAGKGRAPRLRLVTSWDLPAGAATVRTYLLSDDAATPAVLYQVPVVARATETVGGGDHVIGSPEPGTTLLDGPHDPAYTRALLRLMAEGIGSAELTGHATGALDATRLTETSVLRGEQSNTSVIFRDPTDAVAPVICKVFRQVHPGVNPDIELTSALTAAGSAHVPAAVGSVAARWPGTSGEDGGSLAFAQEFLPDVQDAWRVALQAAADGEDFTARAAGLGAATAAVHTCLAEILPTVPAGPAQRVATTTAWARRLRIAIADVPAVAAQRSEIERVYAAAADLPWPDMQRIHGDLHLGQVLRHPERGWVVLDFEGEPLRPMAERRAPDLALRDVAGMLRSFDYVGGSIRLDRSDLGSERVRGWVRGARDAFLAGYARGIGADLDRDRALLSALELDKAVYEAIYEARNRPTWVTIPLRAIDRLVTAPPTRH